jgi:hypothetical protein
MIEFHSRALADVTAEAPSPEGASGRSTFTFLVDQKQRKMFCAICLDLIFHAPAASSVLIS